jgi:predicted GNAT family acetyltransferase
VELFRPSSDDASFEAVLALAKTARQTVGFLPDSAFAQRAKQGTLLILSHDDGVAAYALYDLPRDEIRIVQLVVASGHREGGLARQLVEAVADAHPERRGILLHCREDFPAHQMWPKLDFIPVGRRPGRSIEGKPLTRWYRPFGQPDLFTYLHEKDARPLAVLDSCVFFDLVAPKPKEVAQQLKADWLGEHVRVACTDHLLVEIHAGRHAGEADRQRQAADHLMLPALASNKWRPYYEQLQAAHPRAPAKDADDLKHVAKALAHEADWLITSDGAFIRRYAATAAALGGLNLIRPAEFLLEIDELARGDRYRPTDLAGTSVTRQQVSAGDLQELAGAFVHHAQGERIRDLRKTVDLAAARASDVHLELIEVDGERRGLLCWELIDGCIRVDVLRVTPGRGESTIGRHLLGLCRDEAVTLGAELIELHDATPSAGVARSFRDEGFARDADGRIAAHPLTGSGSLAALHKRVVSAGGPLAPFGDEHADPVIAAASAERWFAPARVLGEGIPSFVVPIKHGWATALFDSGLAADQLFAREWGLGLRRELVYYRNPANHRGLGAPARLLWYVSGTDKPGGGAIRAVSQLTEVAVDRAERLFHRFKPLGIYGLADVMKVADRRGLAMALRFSQTEVLANPVSLHELRKAVSGDPHSRQVVLQSPLRIDEHMFVHLLQAGS